MAQNLVIVESPAKAKTIEKYLGSAFTVRSSFGHIRDLPERGIGIDVEKDFAPEYEVSEDEKRSLPNCANLLRPPIRFGSPVMRTAREKPFLGTWPRP